MYIISWSVWGGRRSYRRKRLLLLNTRTCQLKKRLNGNRLWNCGLSRKNYWNQRLLSRPLWCHGRSLNKSSSSKCWRLRKDKCNNLGAKPYADLLPKTGGSLGPAWGGGDARKTGKTGAGLQNGKGLG